MCFRHFPLHPETPTEGLTLEELFAGRDINIAASQRRMSALMKEEGLGYGERTMTFNSRLAQELAKWAETQADGERIHDALFRAYFVDAVNLANLDDLFGVVGRLGLEEAGARNAVESRRFAGAVDADWERSRQLGVSGVPTFVVDDRSVVGAQPYEKLQELVASAGARKRPHPINIH